MSSKKSLKKSIRYTCGDLAAECILAKTFINGVNHEEMASIVIKVAQLQDNTIHKMSFSNEKTPKDFDNKSQYRKEHAKYMKTAFKSLKAEFNKHLVDIVKEMNAALPQEQKELNKARCK